MNDLVLIDTDILVDAGRKSAEAISFLDQLEKSSTLVISAITQMELLVGCQNKVELKALEHFLSHFNIIFLNQEITEIAIDLIRRYRLSHGLLIPDALIAATALTLDNPLATKNQKDYRFIESLKLLAYP